MENSDNSNHLLRSPQVPVVHSCLIAFDRHLEIITSLNLDVMKFKKLYGITCWESVIVCRKASFVSRSPFYAPSQNFERQGTAWLPMEEFSWNLVFEYFLKSVEKIQVSWKSDKNNEYFIWWPLFITYHIPFSSSKNEKYFRRIYRENQNSHFVLNNPFFRNCVFCEIMLKNIVESGRPHTIIWRMRIVCWVTKTSNTPRMYNTYCISTAAMVARTW
jgi:hypothetical protein